MEVSGGYGGAVDDGDSHEVLQAARDRWSHTNAEMGTYLDRGTIA